MIQHTFGIPIWENDFDTEEIKLENELQRRWESETLTSYGLKNDLTKSSIDYILQQLVLFTNEIIEGKHKIDLKEFWVNKYYYKDFQDAHLHPFFHFSFTIFKDVPKDCGQLKFLHPAYDWIQIYENLKIPSLMAKVWLTQMPNKIIIFPSFLKHIVTAGKTDQPRVTYSGNFVVEKHE